MKKSRYGIQAGEKYKMIDLTHSQYSIIALDWIFNKPVFQSKDFVDTASILPATARRLLLSFRDVGFLMTIVEASGRKSAVYTFPELLNIVEGREVF